VPRFLVLVFSALLGAALLGWPLYLACAAVVASTAWTWLPLVLGLALAVLAVRWLGSSRRVWRHPGDFLLGAVLGGGLWFSLFGVSGLN